MFAHGGALYLVKLENDEIVQTFIICCDGGDPDIREENEKWYLDR